MWRYSATQIIEEKEKLGVNLVNVMGQKLQELLTSKIKTILKRLNLLNFAYVTFQTITLFFKKNTITETGLKDYHWFKPTIYDIN